MTINNTDVEKFIFEEALIHFPELFRNAGVCGSRLPDVYSGFEALPEFFKDSSPAPDAARRNPAGWPDIDNIRADFPILKEKVNGKNLIWFDNAATTQKPKCVIERLMYYYEHENSNVHRAAHTLARRTTDAYEAARRQAADFLGASDAGEIVFVRGATEGINLVAHAYGLNHVGKGDEILISQLEHHANIVPWQLLCKKTGALLKTIPVEGQGQIILPEYQKLLTAKTKIVALSHVSNVLGTIAPAGEMIRLAHSVGARVLLDGAQAVSHLPVDVMALDCDFYVFSGHKIYAPTGIGILYGKYELLASMTPYQGGGNMILSVTPEESRFKDPPHRFEAGTGSIADAVGLGAALRYVSSIGLDIIAGYEKNLHDYAMDAIQSIPGSIVAGKAARKSAIVSFCLDGHDSDEVAEILDRDGIAVRSGHHCAQPVLKRFGLDKIVRASFALYNTVEEIDVFISALKSISRKTPPIFSINIDGGPMNNKYCNDR